jgi:hypothetical protein
VNSSRFGLSTDDSRNRSARFVKPQSEPPKFGHNMPVTDLSSFVLVNHGEQIVWISGEPANLPVTLDGGARPWR